jgi:hypothetical protein
VTLGAADDAPCTAAEPIMAPPVIIAPMLAMTKPTMIATTTTTIS